MRGDIHSSLLPDRSSLRVPEEDSNFPEQAKQPVEKHTSREEDMQKVQAVEEHEKCAQNRMPSLAVPVEERIRVEVEDTRRRDCLNTSLLNFSQ